MPVALGREAARGDAALCRRYVYLVCDDASALDPLRRRELFVVRGPLDLAAMNDASERLVGLHDFAAFCRQREGATTVRTLLEYAWSRDGALVQARVVADAFCHSMVRALVGAVLEVWASRARCATRQPPAYRLMVCVWKR